MYKYHNDIDLGRHSSLVHKVFKSSGWAPHKNFAVPVENKEKNIYSIQANNIVIF